MLAFPLRFIQSISLQEINNFLSNAMEKKEAGCYNMEEFQQPFHIEMHPMHKNLQNNYIHYFILFQVPYIKDFRNKN